MIFRKFSLFDKNKYFNKVLSYFIYSLLIICITFFITTFYYINYFQSDIINKYRKTLNNVSIEFDTSINEIIKTSALLFSSDDLKDIMFTPKKLSSNKYYVLGQIKKLLTDFRSTKSYIYNLYVFDIKDNLVISADGTCSIEELFNSSHKEPTYKQNLLNVLNLSKTNINYELLAKSIVFDNNNIDNITVLPLIQYNISYKNCHSLFLVELDKSYIEKLLHRNKLTDHSLLYIYDNISGVFYSENNNSNVISEEKLLELISTLEPGTKFKYDNEKYLYYSIRTATSGYDFSYIAIVPYQDFVMTSLRQVIIPTIILIVTIAVIFILSFIYSNKIYTPIEIILNKLKQINNATEEIEKNEFEFINKQINNIIDKNRALSNELQIAIPYVCERYLISILNNNKILTMKNSDIHVLLSQHNFAFKYNYFVAITTNISFTKKFYENYTKEDQIQIQRSILLALKKIFSYNKQIYVFSFGSNYICTIVNSEKKVMDELLINRLNKFHKNLNIDKNLIKVYSGVGSIKTNIDGLFISFRESIKASSNISKPNENGISIYKADIREDEYKYSIEQETKLINALSQGDRNHVIKTINNIVNNNLKRNISDITLKKLYIQIYYTGVRTISMKNLSPYDVLGDDYIDIIENVNSLSSTQIYEYIMLFIEKILSINAFTSDRWNANNIKAYIDENFTKDIYLDKIASHFNVSAKYMSTIIKKTLGMSFQDYVSQLRISEAKKLLESTTMTINDIALSVGFNSRYTFIRMFKKKEGISPSTYRNIKNNIKNVNLNKN